MSLSLYDWNGYVEDLGSANGYSAFADWAATKEGLAQFALDGYTEDLPGLIEALENNLPDDADIESTRLVVLEAAKKAEGILIVSDGSSED